MVKLTFHSINGVLFRRWYRVKLKKKEENRNKEKMLIVKT